MGSHSHDCHFGDTPNTRELRGARADWPLSVQGTGDLAGRGRGSLTHRASRPEGRQLPASMGCCSGLLLTEMGSRLQNPSLEG